MAFDGLGDERGDVALLQFIFEVFEVVEIYDLRPRQKRSVPVVEMGGCGYRERSVSQPVVAAAHRQDSRFFCVGACELYRAFVCLGSRVAEKARR